MTDSENYTKYIKAAASRSRILGQLAEVERELGNTKRSSSKRHVLLERKELLLRNLREEKLRLKQRAKTYHESPDHPVTDHALVRWMERKAKVNVQSLKDSILSEELDAVLRSGGRRYWSDGEMVYVLADNRVITVLRHDEMYMDIEL